MVSFKLEGKEYNMASSWDDVSIDMYYKWMELPVPLEDELPDLYAAKVIAIFTNTEAEELLDMRISQVNELSVVLDDFLKVPLVPSESFPVIINGITYAMKDKNDLNVGEVLDIDETIKYSETAIFDDNGEPVVNAEGQQLYSVNRRGRLLRMIAILCRPAQKVIDHETGSVNWMLDKYVKSKVEDRCGIFAEHFPIGIALAAEESFLTGSTS